MKRRLLSFLLLLLTFCLLFSGCQNLDKENLSEKPESQQREVIGFASVPGIPDYSNSPYVELNGNIPEFSEEEKTTTTSYEKYSELDSLGRCGVTVACIGIDLMPTEDRESISNVKPSGWINKKYDTDLVDGGYLYNRSHLIGFQLTGENANEKNLITGTRYMNVEGMLPFENMVADYIKENEENNYHVIYRVTPIFVDKNLVASGVKMEAYSVEDRGEGICFNVFVYNVQPGITIDYLTGDNWLNGEAVIPTETEPPVADEGANEGADEEKMYILNTNSKRIHLPTCSSVADMSSVNKSVYVGTKQSLIDQGYLPCGSCQP